MRRSLIPFLLLSTLAAQESQRGGSLDAVLVKRLRDPKWGAILDRLEANAQRAEALAQKLQVAAAKAKAKRDELLAKAKSDPGLAPKAEAAKVKAEAAETEAARATAEAAAKRNLVMEVAPQVLEDAKAQAKVQGLQAQVKGAKDGKGKVDTLSPTAPAELEAQLVTETAAAAKKEAEVLTKLAEAGAGSVPSTHRLIPGLESAGVTIHTYFGTRWSNLYRDPQANDTFFRPKGFFALEHEQYFWLAAYPKLLTKWGGGAMIQGTKESDFQETQTSAEFKKAVNATDAASAHAYLWVGGFLSETTSIGAFLQHQFSNYTFKPSNDPAAPATFGFSDVIRSQRRLGLMVQQHDPAWRGSLLEYSTCQDPLFVDSRNRQFLRGRAMYNFDAVQSLGFYLEGSINRGRSRDRDRDDATITLGFRLDLKVWAGQ